MRQTRWHNNLFLSFQFLHIKTTQNVFNLNNFHIHFFFVFVSILKTKTNLQIIFKIEKKKTGACHLK